MTCPFKPTCENRYECGTCKDWGHAEWCASLCSGCDEGCTCGAHVAYHHRPASQDVVNEVMRFIGCLKGGGGKVYRESGGVDYCARHDEDWTDRGCPIAVTAADVALLTQGRRPIPHNRTREPYVPKALRPIGLWTERTTSSGRFEEAKRSGDVFRGSKRDD